MKMKSKHNLGEFGRYYVIVLPFWIRKLRKIIPTDNVKQILYQKYSGKLPEWMDKAEYTTEQQAIVSANLIILGEYSLEQWAIENEIREAYRFSIEPSWFTDKLLCIRIFKTDTHIHVVIKRGGIRLPFLGFKSILLALPVYNTSKLVDESQWRDFSDFMQNHFWTSSNWHSMTGYDGTDCYFEGWKSGKYHLLFDWSPDSKSANNIAHKAIEFLQSISGFNIQEVL